MGRKIVTFWSALSIRTQIFLIILLAPLPVMALSAYQGYSNVETARKNIEDIATKIAMVNAAEISRTLNNAEHFLEEFSKTPHVQSLDPTQCNHLFENFPKLYNSHSNIRTSDIHGKIICSALPVPANSRIPDYIAEVQHKDGFSIDKPSIGKISGRMIVPLDYPIRNGSGTIIGIISAPIDLKNFNPFLTESLFRNLPYRATSTLFAPDMTLLARAGYSEEWVGKKIEENSALHALINQHDGTSRFTLLKGDVERIHGAAPVEGTPWVTLVGIPTAPLDAKIHGILQSWWIVTGAVYFLSLIFAFLLARRTSRPLVDMAKATELVQKGESEVRINTDGCLEVFRFAKTFNEMMDYLQRQQSDLSKSEERYHSIFSDSKVSMLLINPETGAIVDANASAVSYYGWDINTLKNMKIYDINILPPDEIATELAHAEKEKRDHFFFRHRISTREVRDVEVHTGPIELKGSHLLLSSIHDITQRKLNEKQLKLAANVFIQAREGIVITDANNIIVDVNAAFTEITGYTREESIGQNPSFLKSGRQSSDYYTTMWSILREQGNWCGELWNRRKNGQLYAELVNISLILGENGEVKNHLAIFSDITNLKQHQEQLERIAHYDALTGLPNRVLLADRLQQAMAHSARSHEMIAVVYLDLDGFKSINDGHGHETGDALLMSIAQRMKSALRAEDTLARIGGDEFVAVLTNLKNPEECEPSLVRLLSAASDPVTVGAAVLHISASAGVTIYPQDGCGADQLLRHADQAMYLAKQGGKNRYFLFDVEQDNAVKIHREALERIQLALKRDEFVLHYQPKVHMGSGEVIGAEALIRWQHPERGLLPPIEFLPIIENRSISVDIDNWVLRRALLQMSEWREQGFNIPVSINVGARRLQHGDFAEHLKLQLAEHPDVPPELLELELLESSALEDINKISELMTTCQKTGVRFALDDFGTGYSALTYLRRLPANVLKIDQSFIRGMLENPDDLAIVEGVLGMVTAFRCEAIAEGVETEAHGEMLLGLGCVHGQGYGIAKPMPPSALPQWAATWKPPLSWTSRNGQILTHEEQRWMIAEIGHHHWIDAIANFTKESKASIPPLDVHRCHFGRWLDHEGRLLYKDNPNLPTLDTLHMEIHGLGHSIVDLHLAEKFDEAHILLLSLLDKREHFKNALWALTSRVQKKTDA